MEKSSIFISYSHKDENWKERLVTQLRALQLQDSLDLWDDSRISAGEDWAQEIEKAMTEASVSVLLISADALASKFISSKEIPPLLLRREKKDLPIVPVIVNSCPWEEVEWLASMQVRPKGGTPLARKAESEAEADLAAIAREISAIVKTKKTEDEMEEALKEELTMLTEFFTASLDMLCIVGNDGKFKRVNPAWKDTLGFTTEELAGKHFKDFIHPDDLKATREEFGKLVFEGQNVISFENRYRCKNGSYKRIQWTATPTEDKEMVYAVGRETISEDKEMVYAVGRETISQPSA